MSSEQLADEQWRAIVRAAEDALDAYLADGITRMSTDERIGFKAGYRVALTAPTRDGEVGRLARAFVDAYDAAEDDGGNHLHDLAYEARCDLNRALDAIEFPPRAALATQAEEV